MPTPAPGRAASVSSLAESRNSPVKLLEPPAFAVEMLLDDGAADQPQPVRRDRRGGGLGVFAILIHGHDLGQGRHACRRTPHDAAAGDDLAQRHLEPRLCGKLAHETIIQPWLQPAAKPDSRRRFQRANERGGVGVLRVIGVEKVEAVNVAARCQMHPPAEAIAHDAQELLFVFVVAMTIPGGGNQNDARLLCRRPAR